MTATTVTIIYLFLYLYVLFGSRSWSGRWCASSISQQPHKRGPSWAQTAASSARCCDASFASWVGPAGDKLHTEQKVLCVVCASVRGPSQGRKVPEFSHLMQGFSGPWLLEIEYANIKKIVLDKTFLSWIELEFNLLYWHRVSQQASLKDWSSCILPFLTQIIETL